MLVRRWSSFWSQPLDARNRQFAIQVAFFLIVPVGVLLHETGHALATWSVGGHVVQFAWRVYWGFVVPEGRFTSADLWWIALSGNLVSILFGLALLQAGALATGLRATVRYVLLQAGIIEIAFSAVGYPLLSLRTADGDWKIVYDFHSSPVLSTVTAVAHAALLIGVWRWWRQHLQQTVYVVGHDAHEDVIALEAAVAADPGAVEPRLAQARYYLDHGEPRLAATAVQAGLRRWPDQPDLLNALGVTMLAQGRFAEATVPLTRALRAATVDAGTAQRLWANLGIALAGSGRAAEALDAFGHLVAPLADDPAVATWRARATQALDH